MSEGPIKQWRDSWKPPTVSTKPSTATHASGQTRNGTACGRRGPVVERFTCSDCGAARRADTTREANGA